MQARRTVTEDGEDKDSGFVKGGWGGKRSITQQEPNSKNEVRATSTGTLGVSSTIKRIL